MKSMFFLFATIFGLAVVFSACKGQSSESRLSEYPSTSASQPGSNSFDECREADMICGLEKTGMAATAVGALPFDSVSCIAAAFGQGISAIQNKISDGSFYSWLGSQGGAKVCAAISCAPGGSLGPFEPVRAACTAGSMIASGMSCGIARGMCEDAKRHGQPIQFKACSNPAVAVPGCHSGRAYSEGVGYSIRFFKADQEIKEDCTTSFGNSFDKLELGSCLKKCVENAQSRRNFLCSKPGIYEAWGASGKLSWTRDQVEVIE